MDEAVRCAPSIVTTVVLNLPPPPPLSRFVFLFISSRVRRPLSCRDLQHEAISAMAASDPGSTKTKPSQMLDYIAPQGGNKVREILVNYLLEKSDEMQKLDNFQSLDEFHLVIHQRQSQFHLVIHQRQDFYLKKDRASGYTRLLRTRIRVGDAAPMAYIEFIDRENKLRQAKPLASQPPQRPPLDPWTKSRLSRQFAPPKEDKSSESDA